jgi:hypothetical protein
VNPQFHDEFVALSALYYSGEISEEEWALLQIHMAYCDSCHERFLEYQQIMSNAIPAMAAVAASELDNPPRESAKSLEDAERRLLNRLDSLPAQRAEQRRRPEASCRLPLALIAACGLGAVVLIGLHFVRANMQTTHAVQVTPVSAPTREMSVSPERATAEALERSKEQVASLEQQIRAEDNRLREANSARATFEKQLEAEQNAHKELSEEKERLNQQLATAQTELDSIRNKWASEGTDASQQAAAHATALNTEIRELKAALDEKDVALSEKDRMLALDKDFLAHDRDIRDLIAARNLYITDIFDTSENGKTAKQFGRIFYTRDRSLIFYGFDLDGQAGRKRDVSFQVWGNGSDRAAPVSLGLFYQDETHKRWVLRCNDARTLARLDMVFVTVEPPGGSSRPTGKQLLRAYLQVHPNHP